MSMLLLIDTETARIDSTTPSVSGTSPKVTQADNPGQDLALQPNADIPDLPDPALGGQNGSLIRNGFSTGFRSLFNRQQPFSGAVATPPPIENPVQGRVGLSQRAGQLYAGVMDQNTIWNNSQANTLAYVGIVPQAEAK